MLIALILAATTPSPHDQWTECLSSKGSIFARTQETTEVAAVATMGACKQLEDAYFAEAYRTPTIERFITGPRKLDGSFRQQQDSRRYKEVEDTRQELIAKIAMFRSGVHD